MPVERLTENLPGISEESARRETESGVAGLSAAPFSDLLQQLSQQHAAMNQKMQMARTLAQEGPAIEGRVFPAKAGGHSDRDSASTAAPPRADVPDIQGEEDRGKWRGIDRCLRGRRSERTR